MKVSNEMMVIAAVGGVYIAAGVLTAVWTISRASQIPPAKFYTGTPNATPALRLAETIMLWPWAVYQNLAPV